MAITELGQNERRISQEETLHDLTRGWAENVAARSATNRHFDSGQKRLYGGTGLIVANELSCRITKSEADSSGLGRWTSVLVQGRQGVKTRIISAYRPCWSTSECSVNMQHHLFFADPNVDPRAKFIQDLTEAIIRWQNQGELIILAGDMNTGDKGNQKSMEKFWAPFMANTGLIDAHKTHLRSDWLPNTQDRGKVQIDNVFVSPTIVIKRCGFLPFGIIPSDHRGLWVDFSTDSLLGLHPPKLPQFQARRLKLIDPRVVSKYQKDLMNLVESKNLIQQIEGLQAVPVSDWNRSHTTLYQEVSATYRDLMIRSEKRCRRIFKGVHPWSPAFDRARKTYFLWSLIMKQIKGEKVAVQKILSLKKFLKVKKTKVSLSTAVRHQSQARKEYRLVKSKSKRLRESYLESLAEALAGSNKNKKASHIKALINREKIRDTFRKIKIARNRLKSNPLSVVSVKDPQSGVRKLISDKDEIEDRVMAINQRKFQQTEGKCPLMMGPMRRDLGTTANTEAAKKVLSGEYQVPQGYSKATRSFINSCKKPKGTDNQHQDIVSLDQYRKQWSKARENTSSGEAHFGMWKAGAKHETLGRLEWVLSILPFKHGFSPDVWKEATDVMILKASGNTDLEALRTVVLYEADFNFVNKQIGRLAVNNAANSGRMVEEQFAKTGSSPIDQCVCRRIIFDLVRFQRASVVMCSTDLLSCYDRIVHSAASLAMQSFGVPMKTMHSMFATIQNCRHKIRTGLGTSTKTYGGTILGKDPLMGVGQGNGAGPAVWSILSCILFKAMHDKNMATRFKAKWSNEIVKLVGFMYVDDNDLLILSDSGGETQKLVETAQKRLTFWNKLIKVTGGAIRMDKSNWYGFHHEWVEDKGTYQMKDIPDVRLHTKDENGVRAELPQLTWSEPQTILGHITSPDGNSKHQVEKLIQIAQEEARLIQASRLSSTECKIALMNTILPRLCYTLTATTITKAEARIIMRPLLDICLPRMGLVKTLGYDYIHGSQELQGLGITDLYHYSFASQIEFIINHIWHKSTAGTIISMGIQELAVELGIENPFKCSHYRIWDGLLTSNSWIAAICEYAVKNNITIQIPLKYESKLIREGDKYIMEEVAQLHSLEMSKREIKNFNQCRLFKRVHTLAEILNAAGNKVAVRAWDEERFDRGTSLEFNHTQKPTDKQWESWKKGLRIIQRNFRYQLGKWTIRHEEMLKWDFFLDPVHRRLLLYQGTRWTQFQLLNRRWTGVLKFSKEAHNPTIPIKVEELQRTTVLILEQWIQNESLGEGNLIQVPQVSSLNQLMNKCDPYDQEQDFAQWFGEIAKLLPETEWAFKSIRFQGDMKELLKSFTEGEACLVGDGSFKRPFGAGASVVASANGEHYIIVSGPTPGSQEEQSAYRSEIGSLVGGAILRIILAIATSTDPKIRLACDNEKALRKVASNKAKVKTSWKHSDLISVMVDMWGGLTGKIQVEDVRGHADELKEVTELSLMEKLNTLVDAEAKLARSQMTQNIHRTPSRLVGFGSVCIKQGHPTIDNHSKRIQQQMAKARMHQARGRVLHMSTEIQSLTDDKNMSSALKGIPVHRQIFLTKWISRQLPVGKILRDRNHAISDKCPECQTATEDVLHLLQCDGISALENFEQQLGKLEGVLKKLNTDPILESYLIETLRFWRQYGVNHLSRVYPSSIGNKALFRPFADQEKIGWHNFLLGIVSSEWSRKQQKYYDQIGYTVLTGNAWMVKIIRTLWEMLHSIWIHRNEMLHAVDRNVEQRYSGHLLQEAIGKEYAQGVDGLHRDFKYLFDRQSLDQLLLKTLKEKKLWFKTIRLARERSGTATEDIFSTNGPLRIWIGLPKRKEQE